jgi:hypothetical protein
MKTCSKCGFPNDRRHSWCNSCSAAYMRDRRMKDPEGVRKKQKQYLDAHREQVNVCRRARYERRAEHINRLRREHYSTSEQHREKVAAENRRRYSIDREKRLEYQRLYWQLNREKRAAYVEANRDRISAYNRRKHEENRVDRSTRRRRQIYGTDGKALFAAQQGKCAVCGIEIKFVGRSTDKHKANFDHCHRTGILRGLTCWHCNTGMGHFKDDPSLLRKAAEYLERTVIFE